jgi:Prenyltransferase and squalene oxidase repeat
MASQNADGSWGGDSLLDRIVATCHGCMALLSAGFMPADDALRNAFGFLLSDRIAVHTWGFWRIAPLVRSGMGADAVEADLRDIRGRVERRSGAPHPDQVLELFLVKILVVLGRHTEAVQYVEAIMGDFKPDEGWFGRADTTTHAAATLAALSPTAIDIDEVLRTAGRVVRSRYVRHGPGHISWSDRVSTTSYTLINLLESPLWDLVVVRDLSHDAVRWICSLQRSDGSWAPETPPYGGEGEIVHPAYFTAVALRGIIAYVHATKGNITAIQSDYGRLRLAEVGSRFREIQAERTYYLTVSRRWRLGAMSAFVTLVVGISALLLYQFKSLFLSNWASVAGIAVIAFGAVVVMVLDLLDYLVRLLRWLGSKMLTRRSP